MTDERTSYEKTRDKILLIFALIGMTIVGAGVIYISNSDEVKRNEYALERQQVRAEMFKCRDSMEFFKRNDMCFAWCGQHYSAHMTYVPCEVLED